MSGMKGIEFLPLAPEVFPKTSQILLRGQSDNQDLEVVIKQCQVQHFVAKPRDPELIQLLSRLKQDPISGVKAKMDAWLQKMHVSDDIGVLLFEPIPESPGMDDCRVSISA
jgi:response regulator RpfG family c-di-GMP phosphodiesterase